MPAYSLINPNQQKRRWSGPGIVSSSFTVFALALLGCEKVPTFKEITGQESKPVETSKSVPTDQSDGTVAPVKQPVAATPIPVENPQEVLATFSSTPTFQRSDKDLARLAGLPGVLESISEMDLMGASGISDVGIQHITKFPNIEHLNLTGTKVTPLGVPVVSSLSKLKSLDMRGFVLDRDSLNAIVKAERIERLVFAQTVGGEENLDALCRLPDLREIDLSQRTISDEALKVLANCSKLEQLLLQKDPINGSGLLFLNSKKGPPLKVLNVTSTRFGEKGMPCLKGLDTLEELIANDCGISDQLMLQNLKGLSHLRKLHIGLNNISDFGTQALASIKTLEDISFHGCNNVSDKTLGHIKSHKSLRRLNIMGCRISPTALQAFKKLNPGCEVVTN